MSELIYFERGEEDSKHSITRAKERAGLTKKQAVKMMDHARTRGITSGDCRWSLDRNYLASRSNAEAIAVAYNGYCFIFERGTMKCITMFRLPRHFGQKKTFYRNSERRGSAYDYAGDYEQACC